MATTIKHYCHAVAQLVEALSYKQEGYGFDSKGDSCSFSIDIILSAAVWPWAFANSIMTSRFC